MTPRQLKAWRLARHLSQDSLGEFLGVSRVTVNRWEGGLQKIPKMVGMVARAYTPDDGNAPGFLTWVEQQNREMADTRTYTEKELDEEEDRMKAEAALEDATD